HLAWPVGIVVTVSFLAILGLASFPIRRFIHRLKGGFLEPMVTLILLSQDLFRKRVFVLDALIVSILVQATFSIIFTIIGSGVAPSVPSATYAAFAPVIMLITLIPLSVAGWGLREGASIVLFATVGMSSEHALTISVLFGSLQFAIGMISGAV